MIIPGSRPRVIPLLLVSDGYLVKPQRFAKPQYVGDPINVVRIFNDKEVDELVVLDIDATRTGSGVNFSLIEDLASEAFMPIGYGGGVRTVEDAERIVAMGVEKVVLGTIAHEQPDVVAGVSASLGSSSTVVSIDVKKRFGGRRTVMVRNGSLDTGRTPVEQARALEHLGAGEILLTAIDRESTSTGYDLETLREVSAAVDVPVVVSGGASGIPDMRGAIDAGAAGVAAGTLFVLNGKHRAVLVSYPSPAQVEEGLSRR